MSDFWNGFQLFVKQSIPSSIVDNLIATGYDNSISLFGLNEIEIKTIENLVNGKFNSLAEQYSSSKPFEFLPGHKKLLTCLGKMAENYRPCAKKTDDWDISKASVLMQELVKSARENANARRRYSNVIMDFASYIYMRAGKCAYEILCANLPLPQVPTICKFEFGKQSLYKIAH